MKSTTDQHWNDRALSVKEDIEVNIMDIFQRNIEYDYVCQYLDGSMDILEVGCGNGYSTARFREIARYVDAFDYAENMINRAREVFGETNNRFIHDNVLDFRQIERVYDAVVCVRVLINLRNLDEQKVAIRNLISRVKPGGLFILAEGFKEGFAALSGLRRSVGLPDLEPARINFYSSVGDILAEFEQQFMLEDEFHLGAYDYLTRVVYPLVVGAENVRHNTVFSEKCQEIARAFNPDCFRDLSRMRGVVMRKAGK